MTQKDAILRAIRVISGLAVEADQPALTQARKVFKDPNTVGVGYGYKITGTKQTNQRALMVFVAKKKRTLPASKAMPPVLAVGSTPVPTDVVQTGRIRPQPLVTRKLLLPGYSIGSVRLNGSGTFGAVVKRGKSYEILSNSHVLADSGTGKKGDAILYPGRGDGGTKAKDTIGKLARFRKFKKTGETVDCATASVAKERLKDLRSGIKNLGVPKGTAAAKVGMTVTKTGRTTATTSGKVVATDATLKLDYPGVGEVSFVQQVFCSRYTKPGDSGSLVLDKKTKKAVGLHFAGGDDASVFNPISLVLKSLGVTLVTKAIKLK
jgi:hypothetical protein